MKIEVRKKQTSAILISFDTVRERFESASERNRFFWSLHGRKQIVVKNEKRYEYEKEGLLEEIPNIRVDNSVFIVAQEHFKRMENFFKEWEDKVEFRMFPVLLDRKEIKELRAKEVKIE